MSPEDRGPQPDISGFMAAADALRQLFLAYIAAGFNENQAPRLVLKAMEVYSQ